MDIDTLIDFCKENCNNELLEIGEIIDLLIESLKKIKSNIGNSLFSLADNGKYALAHQYLKHSEDVSKIIDNLAIYLNNISDSIIIDENEEIDEVEVNENSDVTNNTTPQINYNDKIFDVDSKIPHSLYEDFTYTRPTGIKINNDYLNANEWKVVFNKTCQYLFEKDKELFNSFLTDPLLRGRKCLYFSRNKGDLRDPLIIDGTDIYTESNVNANFVRNILHKMFERYEIPKHKCSIYLRRDLTALHNTEINTTEQVKSANTPNDMKIGQFAKNYFASYFKSDMPQDELQKFTDKEWCHNTFGICYPILKQVDAAKPISEQVNYNNQYQRYYVNPVLQINNKHYIICSQWFESFKPKLTSWINSIESNLNINLNSNENRDDITLHDNIVKFAKKYSSISIPIDLFLYILTTISQYENRQIETGKLKLALSDVILSKTNYGKSAHVINNIRKYLEDKSILTVQEGYKTGKYIITNYVALQDLINKYSLLQNTVVSQMSVLETPQDSQSDVIDYNCKVCAFSYDDKRQIFINTSDIHDEYNYLHDECIGKKSGDKFSLNFKRYVIVSFKKIR